MGLFDAFNRKAHFTKNKENTRIRIDFDFAWLTKRLNRAQEELDKQVWDDVQRYMPLSTGALRSETNSYQRPGEGKVYLYPPHHDYGHYQYKGIVYKDPVYHVGGFYNPNTGKWWSRPGVAKVPSNQKLKYTQPNAKAEWGVYATEQHLDEWRSKTKKILKGKK